MIYAIDTEFIDDGKTIDLISLALVAEDGHSLYVQNLGCDFEKASPWVQEHVLPYLIPCPGGDLYKHRDRPCMVEGCPWLFREQMADCVQGFLAYDSAPVFWGYYADYDWVVFCQLFGPMIELPKTFPKYCRDIKQWLVEHGHKDTRLVKPPIHHALQDARWIMETMQSYSIGK